MIEIALIVFALGMGVLWVVQCVVQELGEDEALPPVTQRPPQPAPSWVYHDTRRAAGRHSRPGPTA